MEKTKDPWNGLTDDEQFNALNEGLVAWQIMEWFEKENPSPDLNLDCPPEPGSDLDVEWNIWSMKLCNYADGWRDALKALEERKTMEKETAIAETRWDYILRLSVANPDMFWQYHSVDTEGYMMRQVAIGFDEEEYENDLPNNE